MMKKKTSEELPPGIYIMKIDRVRKVRNKNLKRIHMTILETGDKMSQVIRPEEDFS